MLEIMNTFVLNVEKDLSNISDIVPHYLDAHSRLFELNTNASIALAKHLHDRFTKTCPLQLP